MSSWTMMGSLVSYFKQHHGPDFFVKLNCAYYLPGLPLALLQQHYDSALDARFGSHAAYLARNLLAFFMLTLVLLRLPSIPASDAATLLGLTSVMGTFSWLAHGTASTVVSMFPPAALAWLQSGFRMPEMYTLGKHRDELIGWAKNKVSLLLLLTLTHPSFPAPGMVSFLQIGAHSKLTDLRLLFHATAALVLTGAGAWVYLMSHPATRALLHLKDQGGQVSFLPVAGRSEERSGEEGEEEDAPLLRAPSSDSQASGHSSTSTTSTAAASHTSDSSNVCTTHPSSVVVIRALSEAEKDFVEEVIAPCRWALFITIASSIFQASFLAYVRSSRPPSNYCVCELLYFVRLFADFLGRPLARLLPRLQAFSRPSQLVHAALARLSLLILFLAYISFPTHILQSDVFVTLLVAVFALLSGYLVVLSYEYAAQAVDYCKAYQAYAGTIMNLHFQAAGFVAVLCGLLFVDLGLCPSTIA
jgi:hypothetical protein